MVIIDHLCSLLGSAVFVSASEESTKANALGQEDDAMPLRYTSTPSSDSLINIDRFSLISEIVMLLRSLLACPSWNDELTSSFGGVLATLSDQLVYRWDGPGTCKRTVRDTACDPRRVGTELGMILAAIYAMGGHVEGPRVGAHVVVPSGTEANSGAHAYKVQCACRGTVARYSSEAGQAFVLIERRHVECIGHNDRPTTDHTWQSDPDASGSTGGWLAVILPIHKLVFEIDVAEQPPLFPLPEIAVSSARIRVSCALLLFSLCSACLTSPLLHRPVLWLLSGPRIQLFARDSALSRWSKHGRCTASGRIGGGSDHGLGLGITWH
jgi:hypothetical protein